MKLQWDETGKRFFEYGVSNGVLYPYTDQGAPGTGVAWNGLTSVKEQPEGGETNDQYADNIKYASLTSSETFKASIEAFTYPDEFAECDGSAKLAEGVYAGQQTRKKFGFSYLTNIGNDVNDNLGSILHIIYGCKAAASERPYETINDSPEAITFSWDVSTDPVKSSKLKKPTSHIYFKSTELSSDKWTKLTDKLWGTEAEAPTLPSIDEILELIK